MTKKLEVQLEALERLRTAPTFMGGTIEYQACTKSETMLMQDYGIVKQALLTAEKSLKALEIIKGKRVNVGTFIHLTKVLKKDYEQCKANNDIVFCNICDTEKDFLTEEELNLLREVLE